MKLCFTVPLHMESFLQKGSIVSNLKGQFLIGWGEKEFVQSHKPYFYFPDFFLKNQAPGWSHKFSETVTKEHLLHLLDSKQSKIEAAWTAADRVEYDNEFYKVQKLLEQKKLRKAVIYIKEVGFLKLDAPTLSYCLRSALEKITDETFLYGFWDENEAILGVTPEIFFNLKDDHLKTVACAGTTKTGRLTQKDVIEHQLVVQSIVESLSPFGLITRRRRFLAPFLDIQHWMTPIELQLTEKISVEGLIDALHPTAALGAYPREPGMKWLTGFDKRLPRTRFGAPVGAMYKDSTELFVAIRNIQWQRGKAQIIAGAGLIEASDIHSEWDEMQIKLDCTKEMLGLCHKSKQEELLPV